MLEEKTEDVGKEKHVPLIEKTEKGVKVKVGSVAHPMEEAHYIEWIEVVADGKYCRKFLKLGDKSEAEFEIEAKKSKQESIVISMGFGRPKIFLY